MSQVYCITDYETRSEADLPLVGGHEYSRHPTTRILCVAWRIGTRETLRKVPVKTWSPYLDPKPPAELVAAFRNPTVTKVAHNAFFEQVITAHVLPRYLGGEKIHCPPEQWICTASQAAALALPRKLADACAALGLLAQKDMAGHRLMLKLSKPRKATKNNAAKWHNKVSDLKRVIRYCAVDVEAETELFLACKPLIPPERRLWLLDQKVNWRGFQVDRPLVKKIRVMIAEESERFAREVAEITGDEVRSINQCAAILQWLAKRNVLLPNLQAKTVADAMAARLASGKPLALLQLRAEAAKASTKKYAGLDLRSRGDGRIRDSQVYHGASTGRDTAAGVQVHNFPRGTLKDLDTAAEIILEDKTDLDSLRLLYGSPIDVFSNVLKACIVASPGKKLFWGDYSGIEVRVLFWMARHEAGLQAYRDGVDLYIRLATAIYKREITKKDTAERQLGKEGILGGGFGMGFKKFIETCAKKGIEISEEMAKLVIKTYRTEHAPVPKMWSNVEKAAIAAVLNPTKRYSVNRTKWFMDGKFLMCQLPSGRCLAYYGAEVRYERNKFGQRQPKLYHWDVHPKTKKWVLRATWGGVLTENVVQATARDIMMVGKESAEDAGYEILFTVHDEELTENETGTLSEFTQLMSKVPEWCPELPIKVEAWTGERYG